MLEAVVVSYTPGDNEIFTRTVESHQAMLAIYVDDLFIACGNINVLAKLKLELVQKLDMKDLGIIKHYLDMDVGHDKESGRFHYVNSMLRKVLW